jgi:hypothetical protein
VNYNTQVLLHLASIGLTVYLWATRKLSTKLALVAIAASLGLWWMAYNNAKGK